MDNRRLLSALAVCAFAGSVQARAQESTVTHKSLSPEIALDLAQAALADCRRRGPSSGRSGCRPFRRDPGITA
jgi:hypothetical protein